MKKPTKSAVKNDELAERDIASTSEVPELEVTPPPKSESPGSPSSNGEPEPKPEIPAGPPRHPVSKKFISHAEAERLGVEFRLEEPKPKKRGGMSLKDMLEGDPEKGAEKKAKRKKGVKSVTKITADDLAELILVPGIILLATWAIDDDDLEPIEAEVHAFVNPLARIMERHLPTEGEIPADILDLGLMALSAFGYFSRIIPIIKQRRRQAVATQTEDYDGPRVPKKETGRDNERESPSTRGRLATDRPSGIFIGGVI